MNPLAQSIQASLRPFLLEHPQGGPWIVHGPGDVCGGLFTTEAAARKFIREQGGVKVHVAANEDGVWRAQA